MEHVSVHASDLPWQEVPGAAPGMKRKILRIGSDGKPRAALIRLEPGFEMEPHAHDLAEGHYVLEGMYEYQGREHRAGAYHWIPKGASHGPFRSRAGALILVTWEP